jgi:hypothetical protein
MIFEMSGRSAQLRFEIAVFVEARAAKTGVPRAVIIFKVEAVLDKRRAKIRVIADAIPAHPVI